VYDGLRRSNPETRNTQAYCIFSLHVTLNRDTEHPSLFVAIYKELKYC